MVEVDYMVLADAAASAGGKHYIHGCGWDTIYSPTYPMVYHALHVAFLLRVPWNETNVSFTIHVDVLDPDGTSILPPPGPMGGPLTIGRPANAVPGNDILVPMVFILGNIEFKQAGDYVAVLRREGEDVKRFGLHLVATAPQMQFTGMPIPPQ